MPLGSDGMQTYAEGDAKEHSVTTGWRVTLSAVDMCACGGSGNSKHTRQQGAPGQQTMSSSTWRLGGA